MIRVRLVLHAYRWAVVGICVVALCLAGAQQEVRADDLSNGAFKREVLALIKRERPQLKATNARRLDSINFHSGVLGLENLFRSVRHLSGQERRTAILAFIDSAVVPDEPDYPTLASAAAKLRVQIIPTDYVTQFKGTSKLVSEPLSRQVAVAYALDQRDRMKYLNQGLLATWKVDAAEVRALAIANLEAISAAVPVNAQVGEGGGRFWAHYFNDGYGAARILCPEFVKRLKLALGDKFFVGIPNRDILVVWSPDLGRRAELAKQIRRDFGSGAHPRSSEILAMDEKGLRLATRAELRGHGR